MLNEAGISYRFQNVKPMRNSLVLHAYYLKRTPLEPAVSGLRHIAEQCFLNCWWMFCVMNGHEFFPAPL